MKKVRVPKKLQGVLWSVDVKNLDIQKSKSYIINQILSLGVWGELSWLFRTYPLPVMRKVFVKQPAKVYTFSSFNFCKKILLGLENKELPAYKYVKTLPRYLGH